MVIKIGFLTASISRQAGGVFNALCSQSLAVSRRGCEVAVFGGRDSDTENDRKHWDSLEVNVFPYFGPNAFGFMPGLQRALDTADIDILHTHGLWMYPSIAASTWSRRTAKPYIVSPHGMLDSWALKNSASKKRIAAVLFENTHLRNAACLHALCEAEYRAIRAYGLRNPVAIIPNGVELPKLETLASTPDWSEILPPDGKVLLYLGRIHPKKGLGRLLQSWAQAIRDRPIEAEPWRLVIAGWDQGGHQAELEEQVLKLGIVDSVLFVGPQFDGDKIASLIRADAFVLPSLSEGVPVSVLEAWSFGLPVLMTPQCNLAEGFDSGAALPIESSSVSLARCLLKLFGMKKNELDAIGNRGRQLVIERFTWGRISKELLRVYGWLIGKGDLPVSVRLN
ncbi:MAG: glycosyltransferase [Gammaproteobacteria bacterium]